MAVVASTGSSNENKLCVGAAYQPVAGPTPYSNTSIRISGGAAQPPANAMALFANGLVDLLGDRVDIVHHWCGGGAMLLGAGAPNWEDTDTDPATTMASMLSASTPLSLHRVTCGFNDYAAATSVEQYIAALVRHHARICSFTGQAPDKVPCIVAADPNPLAGDTSNTHGTSPFTLDAMQRIARIPWFFPMTPLLGYPRDVNDTVHLTGAGYMSRISDDLPLAAKVISKFNPTILRSGLTSTAPSVIATTWSNGTGSPSSVSVSSNQNFAVQFVSSRNFSLFGIKLNVISGSGTYVLFLYSNAGGSPGTPIGTVNGGPATTISTGTAFIPGGSGQVGIAGVPYWVIGNPAAAGSSVNLATVPPSASFMSGVGAPIASIVNNLSNGVQLQIEINAT